MLEDMAPYDEVEHLVVEERVGGLSGNDVDSLYECAALVAPVAFAEHSRGKKVQIQDGGVKLEGVVQGADLKAESLAQAVSDPAARRISTWHFLVRTVAGFC
jgi:hypothetical protein